MTQRNGGLKRVTQNDKETKCEERKSEERKARSRHGRA